MGRFSDAEVAEAFEEYKRRGVGSQDWPGWGSLFTDDALYLEHHLGRYEGRETITEWIVQCMAEYPSMSLWIEWAVIGDDRVAFYIWNNLPDPAGTGKRYGFPNTTVIRYAGDGRWDLEEDFYNPDDAGKVFLEWFGDGGRLDTPADWSLQGIEGWAPPVPEPAFPCDEVEREFQAYRERGARAVATGDWNEWAEQFTVDARYREHHYGTFEGREAIREWITSTMVAFPTMTFPVDHHLIDGNRVIAQIPNVLPDPAGGDTDFRFDVHVILHYAGDGLWSYEEDVYNPNEAQQVIGAWLAAGGTIPS